MSWDFDFDEDSSFLSNTFGEPFDQSFNQTVQQFDESFFCQQPQQQVQQFPANLIPQQIPQPTQQQAFQQQQFGFQQQQQQQMLFQQQAQQFSQQPNQLTDTPLMQNAGNQQLIEENNQLREFFLSLKQKAELVENQNQKLKGQLDECRNWFKQAMFTGFTNGSK